MAIPKADIHLHAETRARLDRLLAPRSGLKPHDWRLWAERVSELEPGPARFEALAVARHGLGSELDPDQFEVLNDDANFVVWLTGAMLDAAHDGAVLIEVRFGAGYSLRSGFMSRFREAEAAARAHHPTFHAEAIITGLWPERTDGAQMFEACLWAHHEGLEGSTLFRSHMPKKQTGRRRTSGPSGRRKPGSECLPTRGSSRPPTSPPPSGYPGSRGSDTQFTLPMRLTCCRRSWTPG